MIRKLFIFSLLLYLYGCSASKKTTPRNKEIKVTVEAGAMERTKTDFIIAENVNKKSSEKADDIINTALLFSGVPYLYGGVTKNGMDCSGLLFTSFKAHDIVLPRISADIADEGKRMKIKEVAKGDLLFFKTTGSGKINHVGLVVAVDGDNIEFIHSTTSRGVIVSSLREGYWKHAFVKATRIL